MTIKKRVSNGVIPYLPEEIDLFESEVKRYRAGDFPETQFVGFRLKQGVYGQRQADAQMIRVKIPYGGMTSEQLEGMATIAEDYAPLKKGHITTRENIQFHHVSLDRSHEVLRILGETGLTTREACGNTVRNVAGCPKAGVCPDEVFDPTPYLGAYARYFVRHPLTQLFPRKIKTAFSGCESDCALTAIHDIGYIAKTKKVDGKIVKGFKFVVGGGTSIMPRIAPTLYDFVPVDDFLRVTEAVFHVFDRSEQERKNRMKARIKFLVNRVGIDEFRKMVEEVLKEPWARKPIDPTPLLFEDDEAADALPASENGSASLSQGDPDFVFWASTNASAQRQPGYHFAYVTVVQGDLTPDQFRGLARLADQYAAGRCRITQNQNLILRWVPTASLYDLWMGLKEIGLSQPSYNEITDIVTCPGTDTCKLGITSSMGLGRALREKVLDMKIEDPKTREIKVKASGCPNGCAQHHIANIGFHGAAIKGPSGQQVPAYEIFVAGNDAGAKGDIRFGQRVKGRIPAKRAPELLERMLHLYRSKRLNDQEDFNEFVDRSGPEVFEPLVNDLREVGPLGRDTIELYMDWEKTIPYKIERGEGECAV